VSLTSRQGFDLRSWLKSLRSSLRILLVCLVGFFLSWLVLWQTAPSLNNDGAIALYNLVSSNTAVFIVGSIATIGDVIWIPLVFYLYVFRKDPYDWNSSLVLAVAMVSAMTLTTILKLAFGLPRPFQDPTLGLTARFETPTDHGLPSGHTTSAFAVATVIWTRYPSWRIPFTLLGLATGTCMIILGLHFPSDVIAGAFLGIFCGTFTVSLTKYRRPPP
jgi:undecaprenyl-diphosphatase